MVAGGLSTLGLAFRYLERLALSAGHGSTRDGQYEAEDAKEIQSALWRGTLGGVVSSSAMELGLDIGEIEDEEMFLHPPSASAIGVPDEAHVYEGVLGTNMTWHGVLSGA